MNYIVINNKCVENKAVETVNLFDFFPTFSFTFQTSKWQWIPEATPKGTPTEPLDNPIGNPG